MEPALVADRVLLKIVLATAVAVAGVAVAHSERADELAYFFVDDLNAANLLAHRGEPIRVHGNIVTGSLQRRELILAHGGIALPVRTNAVFPPAFKDLREVIVTGRLVQDHDAIWLDADRISTSWPGQHQPDVPTNSFE